MDTLNTLLPGIINYLEKDLAKESLSAACERKRQAFVERLEVLQLGYSPPVPPNIATGTAVASETQKSRSLPNKRHSMPSIPLLDRQGLCNTGVCSRTKSGSPLTEYEEPRRLVGTTTAPLVRPNGGGHRRPVSGEIAINQLKEEESSGTEYENDELKDHLTLPKKSAAIRRFSTHLEAPWTLAGPLSHRYKSQKWCRYGYCVLSGTRLLAYKSGHSLTPNLVVFLTGCTAIYAERDSGMRHVIKLTRPGKDMVVLAADTEEQAEVWTAQINQYARGVIPAACKSFVDQQQTAGQSHAAQQHAPSAGTPAQQAAAPLPELQEDSGFSAPVSSGSEGGSGDGVVAPSGAPPLPPTCPINRPPIPLQYQHSVSNVGSSLCKLLSDTAAAGAEGGGGTGVSSLSRGLISTVRRKVESMGYRRKARKSLPLFQHQSSLDYECLGDTANVLISGMVSLRIPDRLPWCQRWCQLKPGVLEAYHLHDKSLHFALSLYKIELGLATEKKHQSALRLSSPKLTNGVVLFEVTDKIRMGNWIRAFFQAMGIIPAAAAVSYETVGNQSTPLAVGTKLDTAAEMNDDALYDEVCPPQAREVGSKTTSVYIPPPSQRLLDQPLPPIPGPGSESTGGSSSSPELATTPIGECDQLGEEENPYLLTSITIDSAAAADEDAISTLTYTGGSLFDLASQTYRCVGQSSMCSLSVSSSTSTRTLTPGLGSLLPPPLNGSFSESEASSSLGGSLRLLYADDDDVHLASHHALSNPVLCETSGDGSEGIMTLGRRIHHSQQQKQPAQLQARSSSSQFDVEARMAEIRQRRQARAPPVGGIGPGSGCSLADLMARFEFGSVVGSGASSKEATKSQRPPDVPQHHGAASLQLLHLGEQGSSAACGSNINDQIAHVQSSVETPAAVRPGSLTVVTRSLSFSDSLGSASDDHEGSDELRRSYTAVELGLVDGSSELYGGLGEFSIDPTLWGLEENEVETPHPHEPNRRNTTTAVPSVLSQMTQADEQQQEGKPNDPSLVKRSQLCRAASMPPTSSAGVKH